MAIYSGGQAGGGGTAPVFVYPLLAVLAQYQGTPIDHEVVPQPPPLAWTGDMTVTDAPLGGLAVTDSKRG